MKTSEILALVLSSMKRQNRPLFVCNEIDRMAKKGEIEPSEAQAAKAFVQEWISPFPTFEQWAMKKGLIEQWPSSPEKMLFVRIEWVKGMIRKVKGEEDEN